MLPSMGCLPSLGPASWAESPGPHEEALQQSTPHPVLQKSPTRRKAQRMGLVIHDDLWGKSFPNHVDVVLKCTIEEDTEKMQEVARGLAYQSFSILKIRWSVRRGNTWGNCLLQRHKLSHFSPEESVPGHTQTRPCHFWKSGFCSLATPLREAALWRLC